MKYIKSFNQEYKLIKESAEVFSLQGDRIILPLTTDDKSNDEFYGFEPARTIKDYFVRINTAGLSVIRLLVDKKDDMWTFKHGPGMSIWTKGWYLIPEKDIEMKIFSIWTSKDIEGKNHNIGTWDIKNLKLNINNLKLMKYLTAIMVEK